MDWTPSPVRGIRLIAFWWNGWECLPGCSLVCIQNAPRKITSLWFTFKHTKEEINHIPLVHIIRDTPRKIIVISLWYSLLLSPLWSVCAMHQEATHCYCCHGVSAVISFRCWVWVNTRLDVNAFKGSLKEIMTAGGKMWWMRKISWSVPQPGLHSNCIAPCRANIYNSKITN